MSSWSDRVLAVLHSLAPISESLAGELRLPRLYDRVVQVALVELRADRVALMLCDGDSDRLSVVAVAGLSHEALGPALPGNTLESQRNQGAASMSSDDSIAGWVAQRCESLLFPCDEVLPLELGRVLRADHLIAGVYVPLIGQGHVLGVLNAIRQPGSVPFTTRDRDLLALLAGQVAISIENARLRATIVRDVSERQRLAQQSAQTEKFARMGRLAASIAHEINNPLHAIHNSLHLLLNRPLPEDKRERYLGMAQEEVERLITIVQRILDVYRPSRDGMRPTALHPVLEGVLKPLTEQLQRSGIIVERDWGEGLPRVEGIASHLKQVFLNLTLNAVEAMPQGGRLTVRTRVREQSLGSPAQEVLIEFTDTGSGIPDSEIQAIFEPFYTTKNNGTGLGLAISYSIVEQHGGRLSVMSDHDRTTFCIVLPAFNRSQAPAE